MKILLVMPHLHPDRSIIRSIFIKSAYPSLTMQQIAAITPSEHEVDIIDERYEEMRFSNEYDLVGISVLTCNAIRGYEISAKYRKMGIPVVFGGYHASLMPQETKQHADSVVIGEAELTWPQLLKDLQSGNLKTFYRNPRVVKAEEIPSARHDIGSYTFREAVQATRGCPTGCEFCAMAVLESRTYRTRPIDSVIDEMKSIKSKMIFFADASLTINPEHTKELFRAMKNLDKKFECYGNINVLARDDEFLRLSRDAGVERWSLGIESISQENINQAGKGTNKVENYAHAIKNIKDHGMMATGFFVFGLDFDNVESFDSTLQAVYDWGLDDVSFGILTPYPGTPIFKRFEKEGRITNYDWSHYNENKINFRPKLMTEEELFENIIRISYDFYSIKNIIKRNLNSSSSSVGKLLNVLMEHIILKLFYLKDRYQP